jgi:hypothetical protein
MVDIQPQESDKAVIWYDDSNHEKTYMESSGSIDYNELCGQPGAGGISLSTGADTKWS